MCVFFCLWWGEGFGIYIIINKPSFYMKRKTSLKLATISYNNPDMSCECPKHFLECPRSVQTKTIANDRTLLIWVMDACPESLSVQHWDVTSDEVPVYINERQPITIIQRKAQLTRDIHVCVHYPNYKTQTTYTFSYNGWRYIGNWEATYHSSS